jgi:hypothetical protein
MTQLVGSTPASPTSDASDLVPAIQQTLRNSDEPLTLSKLKAKLPLRFREMNVEEALQRQVAANVLFQYPKYRSQQDRFWDRPMPVHITFLLKQALAEGPLAWSELRRKLPAYALDKAEAVFQEEIAQGKLHRHPRTGRGGDRFGLEKPDPKEYLRSELTELFARMENLGFTRQQLRTGALELLHDEEWGNAPAPRPAPPAAQTAPASPNTSSVGQNS